MVKKKPVLIIVLLVAVGAALFYFLQDPGSPLGIGFTTISISLNDFYSSDPILNGEVYVMTARAGGFSQEARGTLPAGSDADDKSTEKSFTITWDDISQSCSYNIVADYASQPIKTYHIQEISGWKSKSAATSECFNTYNGEYIVRPDLFGAYNCIIPASLTGYIGNIGTPRYGFSMDSSVQVQGQNPITKTISSIGQQTVQFSSIAYATWQGNLVSGEQCPTAQSQAVTSIYYQGNWRTISSTSYYNYLNSLSAFGSNLEGAGSDTMVSYYVDDMNNKANSALSPKTITVSGGSTPQVSGSQGSGQIYIDLTRQLQFPVITYFVKASTLGIFTPVPVPNILSTSSSCFKTGDSASVMAQIRNDGEDGNIQAWVECPAPFQQASGNIELYVSAGQTKQFWIPITATASTHTEKSCTVKAQALSSIDSKSVGVCVDPQSVCQPGSYSCINNNPNKCNSDGSAWETLDICGTKTCQLDTNGVAQCTEGDVPPPDGEPNWWERFKQWLKDKLWGNFFAQFETWHWIVLSVLATIAIALIVIPIKKRR